MTPQLHAFLNALYLFAIAALFLAVAACIAALMLRHGQRTRAFDDELNSQRLPGEGDVLTDYSRVQDTDWTEFVVAHTRPVPVVDFEEGA